MTESAPKSHASTMVAVGGTALVGMALLSRELHFLLAPDTKLANAIGAILEVQFSLILVQLTLYLPLSVLTAAVFAVLWLFRRESLFRRGPGGWQTRFWVTAVLWWQLFLLNFLLDLDPGLAVAFGLGSVFHLALSSSYGRECLARRRPVYRPFAWLVLLLCLAPLASTWIDRASLAVWIAAQPWLTPVLERAEHWRDRLWPLLVSVMAGQLFAAEAPYFESNLGLPLALVVFVLARRVYYRTAGRPGRRRWRVAVNAAGILLSLALGAAGARVAPDFPPFPGGTRMSRDLAYSFCESPKRGRIAATVPTCSGPNGAPCQNGHIDLYDLDSLDYIDSLHPFDPRFTGRLEQIVCGDDVLLVGMCCATTGDRVDELAVASFSWGGRVLDESLVNDYPMNRVLLDSRTRSLWFAGSALVHRDLASGETRVLAERKPPGIFELETTAVSEQRDSVLVGEMFASSTVREFDRATLEETRSIDTNNGTVIAVAVDDPGNRLYVTGPWGLDALDADSGAHLYGVRLGFASRNPLIDWRHDLIYVPATTNGKIYVLDRKNGAVLDVMSLGFGVRNLLLANQGRRLLASSVGGLWYWDADELAARWGR
jgi:hypothetical protein